MMYTSIKHGKYDKTNQLHAVMLKSQFFPLIVQCRTCRKHAFFFTDFIDIHV
jgi:hypothetical protein